MQRLLHRQRVQHRLQHLAAADHDPVGVAVASGLVIRHAQRAGGGRVGLGLDEIDHAVQQPAAVDCHRLRYALLVAASAGRETESELGMRRCPGGALLGQILQPALQIESHRLDLVRPHPVDGWRQRLPVVAGHLIQYRIQRRLGCVETGVREGDRAAPPQRAQQLGLHLVKQPPPSERVHPFERLQVGPRLQAVDGGEQKLVRTDGEPLQRGD